MRSQRRVALNGIISTGNDEDRVGLVTKRGESFISKITGDRVCLLSHQLAKQIRENGMVSLPRSPPNASSCPRRGQLNAFTNPWTIRLLSGCSQSYGLLALERRKTKWPRKVIGVNVTNSRPLPLAIRDLVSSVPGTLFLHLTSRYNDSCPPSHVAVMRIKWDDEIINKWSLQSIGRIVNNLRTSKFLFQCHLK